MECERMVESVLRVGENTHSWPPEIQTLLLLNISLWVLGSESHGTIHEIIWG